MICFAIGLGIIGFAAMRHARRCHSYAGGHDGGWRGHHHHGRRRWMLHYALRRLDASPSQERAIAAELEKLEDKAWAARRTLRNSREDLAAVIRGPLVDDAALGAVLGAVDAATGEVRAAAIEALRGIHATLDDGQRGRLAEMLTRGGDGWHRGGFGRGPYR